MTGVARHDRDTAAEENMGPVQWKRATHCRVRSVLAFVRSSLSSAQRQYRSYFKHKKSCRLVINAGDFVYVDRPPYALTQVERREPSR